MVIFNTVANDKVENEHSHDMPTKQWIYVSVQRQRLMYPSCTETKQRNHQWLFTDFIVHVQMVLLVSAVHVIKMHAREDGNYLIDFIAKSLQQP